MTESITTQGIQPINTTFVEPELNQVQLGSTERSTEHTEHTEPLTYTRTEAGELLEISNVMVSRRLKALADFHPRHLLIDESDRITEYGLDRIREYGELKKAGYGKKYPKLEPEIEEVEPEIEEPQQRGGALVLNDFDAFALTAETVDYDASDILAEFTDELNEMVEESETQTQDLLSGLSEATANFANNYLQTQAKLGAALGAKGNQVLLSNLAKQQSALHSGIAQTEKSVRGKKSGDS